MTKRGHLLEGKKVFISASFPDEDMEWSEKYMKINPFLVMDGVSAFVHAILNSGGQVVYGGHPTINPLVLKIGEKFWLREKIRDKKLIFLYQSEIFKQQYPKEVDELASKKYVKFRETPEVMQSVENSLHRMRTIMFEDEQPNFAVFLGGKEGIHEEYRLFKELCNDHAYPIPASGGASDQLVHNQPEDYKKIVLGSKALPVLARKVIDYYWISHIA